MHARTPRVDLHIGRALRESVLVVTAYVRDGSILSLRKRAAKRTSDAREGRF